MCKTFFWVVTLFVYSRTTNIDFWIFLYYKYYIFGFDIVAYRITDYGVHKLKYRAHKMFQEFRLAFL